MRATEHPRKSPCSVSYRGLELKPGDDLLSHGETPHYHRRCTVSRLSSGWGQVVPVLCGRQAKLCLLSWCSDNQAGSVTALPLKGQGSIKLEFVVVRFFCDLTSHPGLLYPPSLEVDTLDYMVKPHGPLVLVSSTPHSAYTPSLSTW